MRVMCIICYLVELISTIVSGGFSFGRQGFGGVGSVLGMSTLFAGTTNDIIMYKSLYSHDIPTAGKPQIDDSPPTFLPPYPHPPTRFQAERNDIEINISARSLFCERRVTPAVQFGCAGGVMCADNCVWLHMFGCAIMPACGGVIVCPGVAGRRKVGHTNVPCKIEGAT